MPLQEIEEILKNYSEKEEKVDGLFQKIVNKDENVKDEDARTRKSVSLEEAKDRNKTILKDLETVKGNLRSKAIFSPTEMQWESICQRYQDSPSLPVTTFRCNIPMFV